MEVGGRRRAVVFSRSAEQCIAASVERKMGCGRSDSSRGGHVGAWGIELGQGVSQMVGGVMRFGRGEV